MFPANAHTIRPAIAGDSYGLRRLAELDSQRPLGGHILIGEIDARPAAAISLNDGRVVADPFQHTAQLTQLLRMRAAALQAVAKTPALRERILAGVRPSGRWRPVAKAA
ncbi:MAG TPA: hypothetical protein VF032_10950 [Thermoleophilaceae bacterium]